MPSYHDQSGYVPLLLNVSEVMVPERSRARPACSERLKAEQDPLTGCRADLLVRCGAGALAVAICHAARAVSHK